MPPEPRQLDLRRAAAALARHGVERASMSTVARELGMAKPTLFKLAGSREALVEACVDAEAERLLEHVHAAFGRAVDASPQRRVAEGFLGVFRYARESPAGLAILFDSGHAASRAAVRRVEDRMRDLLRREARAGGRELPDADLLAAALLGVAAAVAPRLEGRDAEAVAIALASAVRD
jgi:AcrR family transcriptional regulator